MQTEDTPSGNRILIIDDSKVNLHILSGILDQENYDTYVAWNGKMGLDLARKTQPDLIILDIVMPDIDGYEVCKQLKEDQSTGEIPVMFISSKNETSDIVAAFNAGGVDYITKPFVAEEIKARVRSHLEISNLNHKLQVKNRTLKEKQKHIEEDLKAAAEIQRCLLPNAETKYKNIEISWFFHPTEAVGGDIFNILQLDEDNLELFVLDVSGHGVSSALVATSVSQALLPYSGLIVEKGESYIYTEPANVLERLDKHFPIERFNKFFTIFFGYLNIAKGELYYSHAAHPFGIIVRNDGKIRTLEQGGTVIGINAGLPFKEEKVPISPGDKLFLYTDGVIEYENPRGEMFGYNRLRIILEENADKDVNSFVNTIKEELTNFAHDNAPHDDVSVVCIEFKP